VRVRGEGCDTTERVGELLSDHHPDVGVWGNGGIDVHLRLVRLSCRTNDAFL
jgi:hypothetical protein